MYFLILTVKRYYETKNLNFTNDYKLLDSQMTYPISIVVPVFDKETEIVEKIKHLMGIHYPEFEVIIVNNGSSDNTLSELINAFELKKIHKVYNKQVPTKEINGIYQTLTAGNLTVIDKEKGSRGDALNAGLNVARYPLFCSFDINCSIDDDTFFKLVKPFMKKSTQKPVVVLGALQLKDGYKLKEGQVNKNLSFHLLSFFLSIEYLRVFFFGAMGWNILQALLVLPEPFAVFCKEVVLRIGGYDSQEQAEGTELLFRIHRYLADEKKGYLIDFLPEAVCWKSAPETFTELKEYEERWHVSLLGILSKHSDFLFNKVYGNTGMFTYPCFYFLEHCGSFLEISGYLVVIFGVLLGVVNFNFFILLILLAIFYRAILSLISVVLEALFFQRYPSLDKIMFLFIYAVAESFGYRQVVSWWRLTTLVSYFLKRKVSQDSR